MASKNESLQQGKGQEISDTCVCDMEWRGTHDDEWGDCVCYPAEPSGAAGEGAKEAGPAR